MKQSSSTIATNDYNSLMIENKYFDKFTNITRDVIKLNNSKVIKANYDMILKRVSSYFVDRKQELKDFDYQAYKSMIKQVEKSKNVNKDKILVINEKITKHIEKAIYFIDTCNDKHLAKFESRIKQQESYYNEVDNFDSLYKNSYKILNNKYQAKISTLQTKLKSDKDRKQYFNAKISTLQAELKNELTLLDTRKQTKKQNAIKSLESFEYHTRKNLIWIDGGLNTSRINAKSSIEKASILKLQIDKLV